MRSISVWRCLAIPVVLAVLLVATPGRSQDDRAYLFTHHAVSGQNARAQQLFDEGLTFLYAYNRQAAEHRFRAAAGADPNLAIAWWGVAMALGPNINIKMSEADGIKGAEAVTRAKAVASSASDLERALIDAVALRYPADVATQQKDVAGPYAAAMRKIALRFPDDPDVEALYMESLLDATTFGGSAKGLPSEESTEKAVAAELARWPRHIGLLHYFIHITEPNSTAQAIEAADTLRSFRFAPEASHLTHMGSHVFVYAGQWSKVVHDNQRAAEMDIAQAKTAGISPDDLDYFHHNLDFWMGGAVMAGDENAARAAASVWSQYNPDARWVVAERFGHPDEALRLADETDISRKLSTRRRDIQFLFGLACAEGGREAEARRVIAELSKSGRQAAKAEIMVLQGRLAETAGDFARARELYSKAAASQDTIAFEALEPWYFAPRQLLAAMELRQGDAQAAARAGEEDLKHNPHSAGTLQILERAYVVLGRSEDAGRIKRELETPSAG
jgi:tetratricopeptide (TPR) repeat protein